MLLVLLLEMAVPLGVVGGMRVKGFEAVVAIGIVAEADCGGNRVAGTLAVTGLVAAGVVGCLHTEIIRIANALTTYHGGARHHFPLYITS